MQNSLSIVLSENPKTNLQTFEDKIVLLLSTKKNKKQKSNKIVKGKGPIDKDHLKMANEMLKRINIAKRKK